MELTKRDALRLGLGVVAAAAAPVSAFAADDLVAAAIKKFTGGAAVKEGGIEFFKVPEIAENGNVVQVGVSAKNATSIMLLADGNPNPGVATFSFGKLAGSRSALTRIRLSKTQNLIAVAKLEDGSFVRGQRAVKVTIGGCGG